MRKQKSRALRRGSTQTEAGRFAICAEREDHATLDHAAFYSTPCQAPFHPPEIPNPLSFVAPAQRVHTYVYAKQYFVRLLFAFYEGVKRRTSDEN